MDGSDETHDNPQLKKVALIIPDEVCQSIDPPQGEVSRPPEYLKDGRYYLEFVMLLVEDCLFMVPKHYFMRYSQFDWVRDTDEVTPHKLDDVEKADFRAFLKFLYPLHLPNQPDMTPDEWVSVLKLASKWMMLDIREAAIKALNAQSWLQKIILARTYGVTTWIRDGYYDYASRRESISMGDVQGLGMENAFKLIHIRDENLQQNRDAFHKEVHSNSIWSSPSCKPDSYQSVIDSCSNAVDEELSGELEGAQATRGADAIERVLWARSRNDVRSLRLAYIELVERQDSISLEEASKLSLETTINLCRARERSLRTYPAIRSTPDLRSEIDSTFKEELDGITDIEVFYIPRPSTPQPVSLFQGFELGFSKVGSSQLGDTRNGKKTKGKKKTQRS